ncbi:cyclic AMP-dependent transcription factor ATF-4-like [Tachypleus tridentatus]|uniref:cyclic AMP-dependent transcription factor ATF-4-like n=1 Tax=Tachypleus tridentatus TaxID=6853 RepID=UPI003FD04A9D
MDSYQTLYRIGDSQRRRCSRFSFNAPMQVEESSNPPTSLQELLVNRDDLKPNSVFHRQPENDVGIPTPDEMTSKRSVHSQSWDNTEVDLTVLEDLESSVVQPTPGFAILQVDNTYTLTSKGDRAVYNWSDFLTTSCGQQNYLRVESTIDEVVFPGSTGETPPHSPVGQAPVHQQQPYIWSVPVTLDSPPASSSGRSSPARSFFFPQLDVSDQSNEVPTAEEILEAIIPREGHRPKGEDRNDACFLVTDASQLLSNPYVPSASSIGNQEFKTSEENPRTVQHSVSFTYRRRSAPRNKNEQDYGVCKSVDAQSRRDRKKIQNKEAATRYRIKKRLEVQCLLTEENVLVEKNSELREKMKKVENELCYLKNLTKEVLRTKGIIV